MQKSSEDNMVSARCKPSKLLQNIWMYRYIALDMHEMNRNMKSLRQQMESKIRRELVSGLFL